ncbi:MAG TPA: VOC family protein [Burkholderiales bacterium]|nr:VOC family protein [Burkholderiales bacterium]
MSAAEQLPPAGSLFVDHVSHFVPDLVAAARALGALGFTVTAESAQQTQDGPAGTSNVCVMLEQGYLEFLAPTADTPNAQRLRATMRRYPGVHLCCFGTPDAEGEHRRLADHGFAPLPVVDLKRPAGQGQTAAFKVVRAAPEKMPEGRIQFVQHRTPEAIWRPQYLGHTNNVVKLACVFAVADDPVAAGARWAHFTALLPRRVGADAATYTHLQADRGHVLIGRRGSWSDLLGDAPPAPALAGYALECRDPAILLSRCKLLGLALRKIRENLYAVSLPEVLGGAWLFGTRQGLGLPT